MPQLRTRQVDAEFLLHHHHHQQQQHVPIATRNVHVARRAHQTRAWVGKWVDYGRVRSSTGCLPHCCPSHLRHIFAAARTRKPACRLDKTPLHPMAATWCQFWRPEFPQAQNTGRRQGPLGLGAVFEAAGCAIHRCAAWRNGPRTPGSCSCTIFCPSLRPSTGDFFSCTPVSVLVAKSCSLSTHCANFRLQSAPPDT